MNRAEPCTCPSKPSGKTRYAEHATHATSGPGAEQHLQRVRTERPSHQAVPTAHRRRRDRRRHRRGVRRARVDAVSNTSPAVTGHPRIGSRGDPARTERKTSSSYRPQKTAAAAEKKSRPPTEPNAPVQRPGSRSAPRSTLFGTPRRDHPAPRRFTWASSSLSRSRSRRSRSKPTFIRVRIVVVDDPDPVASQHIRRMARPPP